MTTSEEELDRQKLLNSADVSFHGVDVQSVDANDKYDSLLQRARTEDLSMISGIGCLYRCGRDRHGRPVICFIGRWFNFTETDLDKALLYLIYLLEPLASKDYTIIYFHTETQTHNHPSLAWIRYVHDVLDYKLKKNLKAFYIVHPTWWTRLMVWGFTTFMAPAIRHKVHNLSGVEFLYGIMEQQQLEIPAFITEHDMTINGLRYFRPESPAPGA